DSIEVSVSVTDEAGNVGSKTQTFSAISTPAWAGYDNMAPRLKASVDREVIDLVIDDVDDIVSYKYGYSDSDTVEPTYGPKASGKACTILAPAGLTENKVYEKVVWIKAKDSNGHESEALKVPVDYDRSFTEIRLNNPEATNDTYWLGEEYPTANITILNGSSYFYFWAEKPAVADPAAAYKEAFISAYGAYARDGKAVLQALEGEFEEHPYNTTHINVAMTAGTKVIKIEDGEYYGGNVISPSESSRPIMLVVGVSKDFGTVVQNEYGQYLVYDWLIRTIEFDTVYSAPELDFTQTRFSTCNSAGQRVDYVRNADGKGLVWPNDINPATGVRYSYPINTPSLFGFAQAEFSIAPDPTTGFERADMDNSYITLEKVYYLGNTMWDADETKAREEVGRWKFSDLQLTNSPDGSKTVIVDFDPSIVSHEYAEIGPDRYGDDTVLPVRYEFAINMRYISDGTHVIPQTKTAIAHYAFCEMPTGFVEAVVEDNEDYDKTTDFDDQYGYTPKNVEAVFDENGNDITSSIPVYTVQTDYFEAQKENAYLRFSGPQGRYSTSDIAYFTSPVMNEPGSDKVDQNNTVKLKLYIGTNPNGPFDVLEFTHDYDRYFGSGLYDIGQHLFDNDKSKVKEVTLYYKFVHPERGTETPLYVLKLRRDNVAPIFDIYVSETEREVGEVLLKLKSLTDTQTMPDGTVLIDTPEVALISPRTNLFGDVIYPFEAWRKPTADDNLDAIPNEDKLNGMGFEYMDGQEVAYIRVKPDEGGLYHFTSKGFFRTDVYDNAGNSNDYVLINGKSVSPTNEGLESGGPRYYINNVDTDPPTFDTAPTVTAGNGKFTISAKADETVSNVYLKFDDAYTELLLGTTTAGAVPQGVFAVNGIDEDNLKSVPGMISGGFNAESGEISAEIYVKYSDSSPAVLLRSVTVIIEKPSGRRTEYIHNFTTPVGGTKPEITNAKNADGYKEYKYGETLDFSVPVKLAGIEGDYAFSYSSDKLAFYSDGLVPVEYIDLFGERMLEEVYANICGTAFAHTLTFTANGNVITAQTPVSADVKVSIDVSKTPNLRVVGDSEFTFTENGTLSYTLNNLETATSRTFTVPILNIDKEAPEALVNFSSETELGVDDNGQTLLRYYSVTYSIVGFSEDDVTMIPDQEGGIAPSSVSFSIDTPEAQRVYTFRFRDSAGNIGTYTADASGIEFSQRLDRTITGYRLTYQTPAGNTFRSIGEFESSDPLSEIKLGLVNNAVSVRIEALNVSGKLVPCTIAVNGALPDGASVYAKEKLVIFSTESSEERVVNLTLSGVLAGNTLNVPVVLPANTIDLSAPSGKIKYEVDPDNADNIRAYLETEASDLAENGVYLTGTMIDGTPFKMEEDATRGYYVTLHVNGAGKFVLLDKAGNIGTVPIGVFSIDKDAPVYLGEAWQGTSNVTSTGIMDEATKQLIKELIETPTNSSISLFIRFNEQLSGAKVQAFADVGDVTELTPTANYVVVETGNNSITVEFKQNCRAKLTVYDLKRNATTLWRPEDGPVSGIDKKAPVLEGGAPTRNVANNMVTLIYSFDEPVMLLQESKKIAEGQYDQGHKDGYKKEHTITFKENGTKFLSFTDEAGNVFSDYPLITEIDDEGPTIGHSIDFVGDGKNLSADEAYVAGGWFTSKDVRILLDIHDNKSLDSEITVKVETMTKSAQEDDPGFELKKEAVTNVKDDFASNEITGDVYHDYNYNLVISRNGFYRVVAKDSYGNENAAEFNISMIDKSGPLIRISGGTLFFEAGGTAEALKTAIAKNVEVVDLQSGANKPLELAPDPNDPNRVDAYKESLIAQIGEGVSMDIDVSGVNLNKPGSYSAIITAEDRLDNISEKKYSVFVVKELYVFEVNGRSVYSGDTIALKLGNIAITDPSPTAKYYYAKETKTEAQMKYAEEFDPLTGFEASEKGYYTIIAKDSGRKTYILYVHAK
ncbi:MAG: hypothetical protein GX975_06685, partial [Clostridiales bacterium]|nr:hypothetical protein [Clostridiales bacterium]